MKIIRNLKVLSKISIVFAVIVTLGKLFVQPEYQVYIHGGGITSAGLFALVVNLLVNVFIFVGASVVFSALATLLEHKENENKELKD